MARKNFAALQEKAAGVNDNMPSVREVDRVVFGDLDRLDGAAQIVRLDTLYFDPALQIRERLDNSHVDNLVAVLEGGGTFKDPLIGYAVDGYDLVLIADGFHRGEAARRFGLEEIAVEVREGSYQDALREAAAANLQHGLILSNNDKRRVLYRMLELGDWARLSARAIGKELGVSHPTISKWIEFYNATGKNLPVDRSQTVGIDGKSRNTEAIEEANRERTPPAYERESMEARERMQHDYDDIHAARKLVNAGVDAAEYVQVNDNPHDGRVIQRETGEIKEGFKEAAQKGSEDHIRDAWKALTERAGIMMQALGVIVLCLDRIEAEPVTLDDKQAEILHRYITHIQAQAPGAMDRLEIVRAWLEDYMGIKENL